jgi:transcriptional regulator with XRE-family HTH domain
MVIGERIRQLRIHKKMTQGELLKGISSVAYLSRIENGKIMPSYSFLEKISMRLNITVHDLLNEDISDQERKILDVIHSYRKTKKLTEQELTLLTINAKEPHAQSILVQIFSVLIEYYVNIKQNSLAKNAFELSKQTISDKSDYVHTEFYLQYFVSCGIFFYSTQIYTEADCYLTKAESLMNQDDTIENASLYYNISLVKQRILEDKTLCLYYSKKAYQIFEKMNDNLSICKVLITRGVQYNLVKDYQKSRDHLLEARELIDKDKDKMLNAMIEYNFGRVYKGLGDLDQSIIHFNNSIKLNELLNLDEEKVYSLRSLIEVYLERRQWDIIHRLYLEAIQIAEKKNMNYLIIELKGMNAKIYFLRGDYYTYEREMQQVVSQGLELKQYVIVNNMALELADYYYDIRSYKKAADYLKISTGLNKEHQLSSITLTRI